MGFMGCEEVVHKFSCTKPLNFTFLDVVYKLNRLYISFQLDYNLTQIQVKKCPDFLDNFWTVSVEMLH